jgi:enoyl-CoA hydratase/carnithine racemase
MLFTGLPLTANEALQAGLISKVVTQENLGMETQHKRTNCVCSFVFLVFVVEVHCYDMGGISSLIKYIERDMFIEIR